jgi:hypothetical protein
VTRRPSRPGNATSGPGLKKALTEGRTIVFLDESGLSERPHRVRTWAPVGKTPVLEFNFSWKKLSTIAGIATRSFCFRIHPGAIRATQVIAFLGQLRRHFSRKLLIISDRAQIHSSRRIRRHLEKHHRRLTVAYLPAYAPELNLFEYLWGYWKGKRPAEDLVVD